MNPTPFFVAGQDRLCGDVYLPASDARPLPVVIYCHGWGGDRSLPPVVAKLMEKLETRPAALVTFDFFGCGETGGSYEGMTYDRWRQNLSDIFAWVAGQPWADRTRIGLFAISSGTTAALRFAITSPECAFVISVATCIGSFIQMPNPPGKILVEHLDDLVAGKTAEVFKTPFGLEFFRDFLGRAPVYALPSIRCPVFFLQGANDNLWRRSDAWIGFQLLKAMRAKHLEVEGGGHSLEEIPEIGAALAFAWLEEINFSSLTKLT